MAERPPDHASPTALITGASGGIGLELAKLFARGGYNLVLVARRGDPLEGVASEVRALYGTSVHCLPIDLSIPEAPEKIFGMLRSRSLDVDVLVNNAGFGLYGNFQGSDPGILLDMIRVNVSVPVHLANLLLPGMVRKGTGGVLNVASMAAFQPGPYMAVYYATKAFLLSFSEAVAEELRGTGVTVTALCPGPTPTGFQAAARMEGHIPLLRKNVMDSGAVAKAGYDGFRKGKRLVIPGLRNRILVLAFRFSPRILLTKAVRWMQERRRPGGERRRG